jgi:cell division septation protein DedD
MAGGNGKRGGGERVLESRHLVGLFLGVVLLCGVFFTLGYVMGRTQYGGPVHASDAGDKSAPVKPAPVKAKETPPPSAAPAGEWDFYSKKDQNHLEPVPKAPATSSAHPSDVSAKPTPALVTPVSKPIATSTAARYQPPKMLKGAIIVQVAALTRESDAMAMADAVQQKKFPAFVVAPTTDNFYRVQVGPYPDQQSAEAAQRALERAGFKTIIKR